MSKNSKTIAVLFFFFTVIPSYSGRSVDPYEFTVLRGDPDIKLQ